MFTHLQIPDYGFRNHSKKINNTYSLLILLMFLFNNAYYAVNEKSKQQIQGYEPTVSVSTKKTNDKVVLTVMDNGNGIPQKVIDKIINEILF